MNPEQSQSPDDSEARPEENPYASPRVAEKSVVEKPLKRPISTLAAIGIVLATVFSAGIAFCCTCVPVGFLTFSIAYGGSRPFSFWLDLLPFVAGFAVAGIVGVSVARALTRWVGKS